MLRRNPTPKVLRALNPRQATRGFTLLELLTGAAVLVILITGVMAAIVATQAAYQTEATTKQATEGSRLATGYVERLLPLAGYGIDPAFAFDFGIASIPTGEKDNYQEVYGPGATDRFWTDDLAFRHRDPSFLRRGTLDAGGTTFTLNTTAFPNFGSDLRIGQAVIVSCHGASSWRVMRVTGVVVAASVSAQVADYGAPFVGGSFPVGVPSCYQDVANPAFLMLMYETRLRVIDLGGTPVLVAFHDFGPVAGNTNYDPLVANVELFQVSYVMNRPRPTSSCCALVPTGPWDPATDSPDSLGSANWIMGDQDDPVATLPSTAAAAPSSQTPYDDALRYNAHPSNIRAVRVSMVVRSPRGRNRLAYPFDPGEQVENFAMPALTDNFFRAATTATIRVPNMTSRAFFNPPLNALSGNANVWGG
ncbi:MAG: prepilin-type cleavage/methylation domain-containing protein [Myxococcaceae bacterium]